MWKGALALGGLDRRQAGAKRRAALPDGFEGKSKGRDEAVRLSAGAAREMGCLKVGPRREKKERRYAQSIRASARPRDRLATWTPAAIRAHPQPDARTGTESSEQWHRHK